MILYLDTSALVKLYIDEANSGEVSQRVRQSDITATSVVAYAEARAAFARRRREGSISLPFLRRIVSALDKDWTNIVVVELSGILSRRAGDLAEKRSLRGFDAIHLASALELAQLTGRPISFLAYDERLTAAAQKEGLVPVDAGR